MPRKGVLYVSYDTPERLFGISVTSDQQAAGLIMKLGGGIFLWVLIVILFSRWVGTQDAGTRARKVVVDERGDIVSIDGKAALTYDEVEDAFERSVPAPREPAP